MEEQKEYDLKVVDKRGRFDEVQNLPAAPNDVIMMAMQKGYTPELIEKMMALQERFEANESRKAFVKAMAAFKSDPPSVYKDKINTQFGSKYSSIDALVNSTIPYLAKQGLSHSWQYGVPDVKQVTVTCTMTHELGHSESVTMSAPPDTSGGNSKNPLQQIRSTQTYLKIATFEAVTGLVSKEANLDDDGNAAGTPSALLNDQQFADIQTLKTDAKLSDEEFKKRLQKKFKVSSVEELTTVQADQLIKALGAIR